MNLALPYKMSAMHIDKPAALFGYRNFILVFPSAGYCTLRAMTCGTLMCSYDHQ